MGSQLRVGVIGCGGIARAHLDAMENWWNKESQQFEKIRKKHLIYK